MRDRPLSASSIKTYLQCMLQYYYKYEDKKPRTGKTDPLAFGIALHEALEYMHGVVSESQKAPDQKVYDDVLAVFMRSATQNGLSDMETYQEGRNILVSRMDTVDPTQKILGLELRFNLKTPSGTPFTGSIDKLIELDSDTVAIIDYKSSKYAQTQDEADSDIQLSMYDLAVSMMFPQYKTIVCGFDYLRLTDVVTHRTLEQRKMFVEFLDAVYNNICEAGTDDVKANINKFCPWCEFTGYCEDYKKLVTDPEMILPMLGASSDEQLVQEWDIINSARRIIDHRYREFKSELYKRIGVSGTIRAGGYELYKIQTSRMSYDAKTVFEAMGKDKFLKSASVGKKVVDKFLQDNPQHIEAVESTASFSFNSPSFGVRKLKE